MATRSERPGLSERALRSLVRGLEVTLVAGFALLTVDVLWGVFSRYVVGSQSRWTEELAIYLLVWISLLGASLTYSEKGHLGVDYFVGKLHPDAQRVAAVVVELTVLLFSVFILVYGGWVLVTETLASGQVSPALGIQMGWLYSAVPISGAFFTVFALQHLWLLVRGREVPNTDAIKSDV